MWCVERRNEVEWCVESGDEVEWCDERRNEVEWCVVVCGKWRCSGVVIEPTNRRVVCGIKWAWNCQNEICRFVRL